MAAAAAAAEAADPKFSTFFLLLREEWKQHLDHGIGKRRMKRERKKRPFFLRNERELEVRERKTQYYHGS